MATPSESPRQTGPHILIVRWKTKGNYAGFIQRQAEEWIEALALHSTVTVIDEDFDYDAFVDLVKPDFVIFESWLADRSIAPRISNLKSHPEIPRLIFYRGDAFSAGRPSHNWWIEQTGAETIFVQSINFEQMMPELMGKTYTIRSFMDESIYRDYGLPKTIPVSIFGGARWANFYPWRANSLLNLVNRLPTFVYTHPGYGAKPEHPFSVSGESYAKILNQSHFSLADSTRIHCVVRKFLEIPASGSILVSPNTPGLDDWGFHDLQNCVLGSDKEIVDKIIAVYQDSALYEKIRKNGYELAHSRYSKSNWTGFIEWFTCQQNLKPGESIQQQGLFGPFTAVPAAPGLPAMTLVRISDNEVTARIKFVLPLILDDGGDLGVAEKTLLELIQWQVESREVWLLLGVLYLLRGEPVKAREHMLFSYMRLSERDGLANLDPVELAWLILIGVLLKDDRQVALMYRESMSVRHVALRRMQWLLASVLGLEQAPASGLRGYEPGDRFSVHWIGREDMGTWLSLMTRILCANGFPSLSSLTFPNI